MQATSKTKRAGAQLLLAMLLFGTIGVFVRYIPLPSSVIALARGVIGTLFLLALILLRRNRIAWRDVRRNLGKLCLAGVFLGANWILLFEAYRHTTVAIATLCYYLAPVFVTLASPIVLKERLTPVKLLCVLAALMGMALASGVFQGGAGGFQAAGVLLGLGAAMLYACIVLLNKRLKDVSSLDATLVQLAVCAVTLAPYALLTRQATGAATPASALILLIVVGVVHTGLAYALYFGSMRFLKAQTVAIVSYLDPIVAILLSSLLLKERLGLWGVIGAALVLGATLASQISQSASRASEAAAANESASLRLRAYIRDDAKSIVGWFADERSFRQWCADKLECYPISAEALMQTYDAWAQSGLFLPMTMVDSEDAPCGHLFMRFTDETRATLRFGFVIVPQGKRGMGYGRALMRLALQAAFEWRQVQRVTLGVFEANAPAERCYRAVGFCDAEPARTVVYRILGEDWPCRDLALTRAQYASIGKGARV